MLCVVFGVSGDMFPAKDLKGVLHDRVRLSRGRALLWLAALARSRPVSVQRPEGDLDACAERLLRLLLDKGPVLLLFSKTEVEASAFYPDGQDISRPLKQPAVGKGRSQTGPC